ncbi:MAG: signal transduction histidine kinase, LytS [Anaerocolumna sp.]|jgi:two-component system sensor histidine kinase YesM|nr:signal transduction histidine kinase, LytS [Anaerocolumna sp.]
MNRKVKTVSLKRRLLALVIICWVVPVTIISLFFGLYYRKNIVDKTENVMKDSLINHTTFYAQKIDEAITLSKKISYDLIIEKAWKKLKDDGISNSEFYKEVIGNLKSKYYNDRRFVISVFYLSDDMDHLYYTSRQPGSYIDIYKNVVKREANGITAMDSSDAHVKIIDGRIYIIRNLYTTTNYKKFGTLVLELDQEKLFEGSTIRSESQFGFMIDDVSNTYFRTLPENNIGTEQVINQIKGVFKRENNNKIMKAKEGEYLGYLYQKKFDDYYFGGITIENQEVIYKDLKSMSYIALIVVAIIIPVLIFMIYFIARHITKPMAKMHLASKELEQGNIGMIIEGCMPNTEFSYLLESFNRMSQELKTLFEDACNEKLARKEAKILALQSQINPHFLNNTLEMMNWQARMAGDETVSKMIEALGTLFNYSMGRTHKKLIELSEELKCADAYFYIISMRFKERLTVNRTIDPLLLDALVPQLILQPILENAVVHGVEVIKEGCIFLSVFLKEGKIHLEVKNSAKAITENDVQRINDILDGKHAIDEGKGKHLSLGIRNVNERIKLIFGESYGLSINLDSQDFIVSTITLPYIKSTETGLETINQE